MVDGFTIAEARDLVRDALDRAAPRHKRWRALEALYRTGSLASARAVEAGTLVGEFQLAEEVVNLTFAHVNLLIATATARDPRLLAVPIGGGPEAEDYAATAEGAVNFFWKRTGAMEHLRAASRDRVIIGNGFVKTGWAHLGEEDELDDDEFNTALADALEEDRLEAELAGEDPSDLEDIATAIDTSTERVQVDEPWVEYASPYDIFVAPNATSIQDASWVIHRITRPLSEVADIFDVDEDDIRSDTNVNHDGNQTPAEWRRRQEEERDNSRTISEVYQTATYFEFWDVERRHLLIFQLDGPEEALYDSEDGDAIFPHGHGRAPFVHVRGYRASGTDFWGFGDVENIANLQQMANELFTMKIDNARRAGNIYFMDADFVTADVRSALESDEPDQIVPVPMRSKVWEEIIHVAERKALSGDVYNASHEVEEYIARVIGLNDFQTGGVGADRMSATAAAVVDSVASLRGADAVRSIEQAASELGQQLLLLCQEFLDEPRAIRISGLVKPTWVEADKEALRGEYLIEVEVGSTREENQQTRQERGAKLVREVLPALVELGYDPTPALRQAIRAYGFDPDLIMQPLPPPDPVPVGPGAEGDPAAAGGEPTEEELMAMLEDPGFAEGAPARGPFERGGPPTALAAQTAGQALL